MSNDMDFRARQEAEAVERMKLLELYPTVISEFQNEKVINKSELIGFLYWIDEEEKAFVKEFESEYNAVVYHIIKSDTKFGCMLSVFYVSHVESEWEIDRKCLELGKQICYVKNLDADWCSEFGIIHFQKNIGGLIRTA